MSEEFEDTFWEEYYSWEDHSCRCPTGNPPCAHCTDCWVCWCVSCEDYHTDKPDEVLFCLEEQELMEAGTQ